MEKENVLLFGGAYCQIQNLRKKVEESRNLLMLVLMIEASLF